MNTVRDFAGPLPTPAFQKQVSATVMTPLMGYISGEVSASTGQMPLGLARFPGRITGVYMSVGECGKRDSDVPRISGEVYINGVSCLTTVPAIGHVSGETSQQKTTFSDAADTGIQAAVINSSANTLAVGDVVTWKVTYSGNTSPNTKVRNPCILVEVTPS